MYYKNPITRFVLRKNWLKRVQMRLRKQKRQFTKNAFADLEHLFADNPVQVILDAGANIGFVTYQLQKKFPEAVIYAFEPNPNVFTRLQQSYMQDDSVHTFNCGIGDNDGQLTFNLNSNSGTSSFLQASPYHSAHQAKRMMGPIEVDIHTLDTIAREHKIEHIDILKMDIEGYELKALQGASALISSHSIDAIYTEISLVPQYEGQPLFHELTSYLESKEYYLYNIYDFTPQETVIRQATIGNAIYISGRFRQMLEMKHGALNCGW